jgi:GT2 family glycosyltransferase
MISIIIPNFNGSKFLQKLLPDLQKIVPKNSEIIIVDNGSTDGSSRYATIKNLKNLGFSTAVNQGIKISKYDYICLLNNDVILDKNWFKLIITSIKKYPKVACFCGTVLNEDGSFVESQGIDFGWSGKCIQLNHNKKIEDCSLKIEDLFPWGSSAAAVIYKKDILIKIGLFDEKYFAYLEDVDVAFRLHQKRHLTLLVPKAIAYHLGGGTANNLGNFRARQTFKNWFYFILKNYSLSQIIYNLPSIFIERLRNLSYLIKSTISK